MLKYELYFSKYEINLKKEKYSIFITGSNSDLLSGELATHIAGRYVSFKVYPFSFKEAFGLRNVLEKNKYELKEYFDDYIKCD